MNKVRIVGFLGCLLAILIIISVVITPQENVYNIVAVRDKFKELEAEKPNIDDVIFIGDSEAFASFSPLQLFRDQGIASYVSATSAQRLCDTYVILEKTLETQNPKLLVIEANCLFRYAGVEKDEDNVGFNLVAELLPVFKYHSRWKNNIKEAIRNTAQSGIDYRGFLYRTNTNPYEGGEYMFETDEVEPLPELVPEYLDMIFELCKEKGVEITFVSAPSAMHWTYEKHNAVEELAKKYNVLYEDLNLKNDIIQIDWSKDTKDCGDHINYRGAVKVTDYYGKFLKANFDLPDRREDPNYADWIEDCKEFFED